MSFSKCCIGRKQTSKSHKRKRQIKAKAKTWTRRMNEKYCKQVWYGRNYDRREKICASIFYCSIKKKENIKIIVMKVIRGKSTITLLHMISTWCIIKKNNHNKLLNSFIRTSWVIKRQKWKDKQMDSSRFPSPTSCYKASSHLTHPTRFFFLYILQSMNHFLKTTKDSRKIKKKKCVSLCVRD